MTRDNPASRSPFLIALHAEIAELRREYHVTQNEIADAIGMSQPYVHQRIRGMKPWTTDDIALMAPLFGGIDAFELIDRAHKRAESPDAPGDIDVVGLSVGELERLPRATAKRKLPIR